jgi:hypothetical protein
LPKAVEAAPLPPSPQGRRRDRRGEEDKIERRNRGEREPPSSAGSHRRRRDVAVRALASAPPRVREQEVATCEEESESWIEMGGASG